MADAMVLKTQQWLNQTYGGRAGYGNNIAEDGITGGGTIGALTKALQLELGITATSTNFGPGTESKFNSRFPNGIQQQAADDESESNIYSIIQGACWCKGYSCTYGNITKHFYADTGNAISNLKSDAGCSNNSSTVTLNVMKALLSMDQFKVVSGGSSNIRSIQQELNREYEAYIGLIPCDGIYGRKMSNSFIKVLQAIEGFSVSEANGTFGPATKANLPIIPSNGSINTNTEKKATKLVRYLLYCNKYAIPTASDVWDMTMTSAIKLFQEDMCLNQSGICDTDTWMALMLSKGNPDRNYNAADTAYTIYELNGNEVVKDRRSILKNNNIGVIGRYITGEQGKQLKFDELKGLLDDGINFYPIFQRDRVPSVSYFTASQGKEDAEYAYKLAKNYCIPTGSIIYFAVDIDMIDKQITQNAIPYFREVSKGLLLKYKVGVYGTRNLCTRVMDAGHAVTCAVSDASTGYSGNLGYSMPENWNIDQFAVDVKLSDNFAIDKNIYSGRYPVVSQLAPRDFYMGKVKFSGFNRGRSLKYSGNTLKLNVTANATTATEYDDIYVVAHIKNTDSIPPNPLHTNGTVYAKLDGNKYDLSTQNWTDSEGNIFHRDFININDVSPYVIEYYVARKIDENTYQRIDDIEVEIEIEVSTSYEEL